jgi:hypothetical protein
VIQLTPEQKSLPLVWGYVRCDLDVAELDGLAGYEAHIGAHPPGPGIIGGCREAEISELAPQVA